MPDGLTEGMRDEVARMIRENDERQGIIASDGPSLQRTQRNNQFLDRAAAREDADRDAIEWVQDRRKATGEAKSEFRKGLMSGAGEKAWQLIGGAFFAAVAWFLARGH